MKNKYTHQKYYTPYQLKLPLEISKLSYKTSLVIQALKALGKENIDNNVIVKLTKALTDDEKKNMLNEAKSTTSWIYEYIKSIARSSENVFCIHLK
ncbi:hypothetical protein [Ruminococcus sp.]|uniref:hypothetical protein n=1 Tax=Ruminococcus sp. TaxID=41978 RepID=UPI003F0203C5